MVIAPLTNTVDDNVKNIFHTARQIAQENLHAVISAPHLVKALLHKEAGLIPLFKELNKDYYYMDDWADVRLEALPKTGPSSNIHSDDSVAAALEEADDLRLKQNKDLIDAQTLLAAIVTPGVGFSFEQLKTFPLKRDELLHAAVKNMDFASLTTSGESPVNGASSMQGSVLLKYCVEKTGKAHGAGREAIIGRDKELRMMTEVLCRRTKPNVLLIGEAGVGKSSLVDGFAQAVQEKKVPELLQGAQLYELDNGALIAGAAYKGEIEDRLKAIFTALQRLDKAILFIDEVHVLTDKHGSAAGAANILKHELTKGSLTIIAATTIEEYKKTIENDVALNRRFEVIKVEEPTDTIAFRMLKQVVPHYETHHSLTTTDDVLHESIRLSRRYIKERKLPDAAIDLLDRTMAALRMMRETGEADLTAMEQTVNEWKKKEGEEAPQLADWKWLARAFFDKLSPLLGGKVSSEADPQMMETSDEVIRYLEVAIRELKEVLQPSPTDVKKGDLAVMVAAKTGIPVGKLQSKEQERLINMEAALKQRVVGQDHAIGSITEAILESRSGLGKAGQPIGSFFFLGPTGTGKTELAKSLAEFLFQDESLMIRFDMSEFKEEHSAALLYGAPPGYVGYEEGGMLVNKIRRQPYSVVLFDEIEKGHSSVFDVFLQIMDEGKLHDKLGKEGDFSNAVIIFTSNIGSQYVVDSFGRGEIPSSATLMEIMGAYFRPEFLGRLTEIVPFAPMKPDVVRGILDIQLKGLYTSLEKQGIALQITDGAKDKLAAMGFTPAYGARPLAGIIRTELRRPLSRKIIEGELTSGSRIELDVDGEGKFKWNTN
jgi:ATP-dependent Clp protease ATP-binding subunit ClpA